jgi:hypothetical protein
VDVGRSTPEEKDGNERDVAEPAAHEKIEPRPVEPGLSSRVRPARSQLGWAA